MDETATYFNEKSFIINTLGVSLLYYQEVGSDESHMPRFRPYTVVSEWRRTEVPIRIGGNLCSRYRAPIVLEYIDIETGEILSAHQAKRELGFWPELHFSERVLMRQAIIDGLRKEVREFARFVREFLNSRRGITPGVSVLARWYALLHGQQPHHVRRHVEKLKAANILAGETLVAPLFQRSGKHLSARAHLAEDTVAAVRFSRMLLSRHNIRAQEEMNRIVNEIIQRVRASSKKCGRWWESYQCLLDDELDEPAASGNAVRDEEVACHG